MTNKLYYVKSTHRSSITQKKMECIVIKWYRKSFYILYKIKMKEGKISNV